MLSPSSSATKVGVDIPHEFLDGLAAMVAGHVVVEVLPQTLDAIVIRAVRRQEVELHLSLPGGQCQLDLTAVMDLEVVEDDVDPASIRVSHRHQPVDQQEEQGAVLALLLDPGELARAGIERPAGYRFWFWPGVGTSLCRPDSIQSGPILGFR